MATPSSPRTAELLHTLFEATASETGEEFFQALVRRMAEALEVRTVFVSELLDGGAAARTLAVWVDDRLEENLEYPLPGTPCERVLQGEIVQINSEVNEHYPHDEDMFGVPTESYLGIPLVGRSDEVLGHVVALNDRPMVEKARDYSTLRVFAARATAELERLQVEHELERARLRLVQSEKMAALVQFTAGMAHELNTPLGVIRNNADLTRRVARTFVRALGGPRQGTPRGPRASTPTGWRRTWRPCSGARKPAWRPRPAWPRCSRTSRGSPGSTGPPIRRSISTRESRACSFCSSPICRTAWTWSGTTGSSHPSAPTPPS